MKPVIYCAGGQLVPHLLSCKYFGSGNISVINISAPPDQILIFSGRPSLPRSWLRLSGRLHHGLNFPDGHNCLLQVGGFLQQKKDLRYVRLVETLFSFDYALVIIVIFISLARYFLPIFLLVCLRLKQTRRYFPGKS